MQKVQRWSQPFCTCTKARAWPSTPSIRCAAVSRHRHDVVDGDLFLGGDAERRARQHVPVRAPGLRAELLLVAEDQRDLGHVGEASRARSAPRSR